MVQEFALTNLPAQELLPLKTITTVITNSLKLNGAYCYLR